jgi:hypothetical protein
VQFLSLSELHCVTIAAAATAFATDATASTLLLQSVLSQATNTGIIMRLTKLAVASSSDSDCSALCTALCHIRRHNIECSDTSAPT